MRNSSAVWTTDSSSSLVISQNSSNNNNNNNSSNNNNNNSQYERANSQNNSRTTTALPIAYTANGQQKSEDKSDEKYFCLNNPFLVGVQSKFRRKYYHKTLIAILVLIILILFIAIICVSVRVAKYSSDICETPECLRAASNLILSMDRTIDPCDDFYRFSCGNWHEEHPRPDSVTSYDWFTEKQNKVMRTIREFLKSNQSESDPEAVNKTKIMYRACMDVNSMNKLGIKPVLKYLEEFKLPIIPNILNITLNINTTNNNDSVNINNNNINEFNWIESLVRIKLALGMDIIVGFDILADPMNRNTTIIAVGTPEETSPLPFMEDRIHKKRLRRKLINDLLEYSGFEEDDQAQVDDDTDDKTKDETDKIKKTKSSVVAYMTYIRKVIEVFIHELDPNFKVDDIKESLNEHIMNHLLLTEQIIEFNDEAENITKLSHKNQYENFLYMTVKEIENVTDELISPKTLPIFDIFIPELFKEYSHIVEFNETRKLITSDPDLYYLKQIKQVVLELTKEKLEFYIWWNVVEELIVHTSDTMRQLHNELTRILIKTEGGLSRSLYCTSGINSLMGMAVSYTLAYDNFHNETLPRVKDMLQNIRSAFNDLVKNTNWMDKETKERTLKKSMNMKSFIGFPDWITNKTVLDEYYKEFKVNITTHLDNMIGVLRLQMKDIIMEYNNKTDMTWATSPSNVNAFHTFQTNTITVPISILQYPFYNLGLEALNYGSIGAILGHELTHGFDDSGRMFDEHGNLRQWWTNKTINEYINRTDCFIKQYERYYLSDVDDHIDGELTLGENIADNGGLREAYYAYKILINRIGREKRLPGLDSYTHEQLLFISFGNLWCETLTPIATKYALEDSHCPGHIRLKGVLTNSPEFSETFNCPKGSNMNPAEKRCRIW
ncbi:neprilysin-1 [Condylostylus longicornis]|uniref:neprilysin-1 n=1 Tax=Condylostylus longicornis TaxID=2530218 RepID=UPI00244DC08F|nr:neprilysin-1 [Condylostylus longicornis]